MSVFSLLSILVMGGPIHAACEGLLSDPETYPIVTLLYDSTKDRPRAVRSAPFKLFTTRNVDTVGRVPEKLAGPQFFVPNTGLFPDERRVLEKLVWLATHAQSPFLKAAFEEAARFSRQKDTEKFRAARALGIEVGIWKIELSSGREFWSDYFISNSASVIYLYICNRELARALVSAKGEEVRGLQFYHFHPRGTPLSPADIERLGLGFVKRVPLDVRFQMNAVGLGEDGPEVYRNLDQGLKVSPQEVADGPNNFGF